MMLRLLVSVLIASVALALPANAAAKKRPIKTAHRHHARAVDSRSGLVSDTQSVYVGGEYIGRDPDPNIRAYMRAHPHDWDGPD